MMAVNFDGHSVHLWLFIILFFVALLAYSWRQKHRVSTVIFLSIFFIYLFFAIEIVFFPIWVDNGFANRTEGFRYGINLIPFNWDMSFIPHIVIMQIVQNILLTVPFGFGISFVMKLKPRDFLWISLALGIGIEFIQFCISYVVGYTYRVIDINDAILNTLGVVIGYALFRVFGRVFFWIMQKLEVRNIRQLEILNDTRLIIQQHREHL